MHTVSQDLTNPRMADETSLMCALRVSITCFAVFKHRSSNMVIVTYLVHISANCSVVYDTRKGNIRFITSTR